MFDWLTEGAESIYDGVRDVVHGPVDPAEGTQGGPMGYTSDGSALGDVGQFFGDLGRGLSSEGIGGILDPVGMMDRAAAHRELASRFNVIDDDSTVGTMEQNQVTPEEYEDIVRTYSDIRLGRGDLRLADRPAGMTDEDYAGFRGGAMDDIADILQTESGRGLIDSLNEAPDQADGSDIITTINPRLDASGNFDPSNAEGGGFFGVSGQATYAPGMDHLPTRDNLRSDVTLYHELVHAHHAVHNTWDGGVVGGTGADAGVNQAEHQAAGLGTHANDRFSENRYRGERRRIGALDVGERNHGAESDDNMTHRDTYSFPGTARTNPATIPGAPSGSVGTPGGPGAGGRIGDAAGHRHDDDEHHHH